jgi:hypothetical protein
VEPKAPVRVGAAAPPLSVVIKPPNRSFGPFPSPCPYSSECVEEVISEVHDAWRPPQLHINRVTRAPGPLRALPGPMTQRLLHLYLSRESRAPA